MGGKEKIVMALSSNEWLFKFRPGANTMKFLQIPKRWETRAAYLILVHRLAIGLQKISTEYQTSRRYTSDPNTDGSGGRPISSIPSTICCRQFCTLRKVNFCAEAQFWLSFLRMSFFMRPCWCTSKSTMTSFRWFIWTMWFLPRWRILVAWSRGFIHFLWLWIASWSHKSRTLYPAGSLGLSSRVAWKMNPKSWGIGLNSEAVLPSADWRLTSFSYYRHLKSCKSEDREQVQGTVGTTGQVGAIENRQVRD